MITHEKQVISGAAPFKSLSNIGVGLHDLLLIPLRDLKKQVNNMYMFLVNLFFKF